MDDIPVASYRQVSYWRRYLAYLPGAGLDGDPVEEWTRCHGQAVHLDRYPSPGAGTVVVVVHGGGGYGRMLTGYCRELRVRTGCEVVAPDLPGYGLSPGGRRSVDYGQWALVLADLVRQEHTRGRAVVLFGASLGGYLSYLAAALGAPVAGLAATTLADPREPAVQRELVRAPWMRHLLPLLPGLATVAAAVRLPVRWFTPMRAIANDPALSALIARDPLGGGNRVSVRFLASLFAVRPAVEPEQFSGSPVLLVHPAADRWTTPGSSRVFFDRLAAPKRLVLLEGCGHLPVEEPGLEVMFEELQAFVGAATHPSGRPPAEARDRPPSPAGH